MEENHVIRQWTPERCLGGTAVGMLNGWQAVDVVADAYLTHRRREKMAAILQTEIYYVDVIFIFIQFHWS